MIKRLLVSLLLILPLSVFAQTRQITGKVVSEAEPEGLPFVTIIVKGTTNGTTTDFDGNYTLSVPDDDAIILVYSYVGYLDKEITIGSRSQINVTLESDVDILDEVIITGYGTEVKADIIGSIASVTPEDFKNMPVVGMDQALQGQAPGVQVTQSSGTPGGGISVRVRGSTSISASNRPLFIVDGVPVEDGALALRSFGGQNDNALATLNPNDIESLQVLKDAAAKAIYGSRAANGVVLITTKRGKSGQTRFNFDVQRGVIDVTNRIDLLNSSELVELQREAVSNAGLNPDAAGLIRGVTDAVNTDWLDEILRTAILQQYQVSFQGGTADTRLYVSGNYRDEQGVQLNNRFLRFAGTFNLDHRVSSRLEFGTNLSLSKTRNDRVKGDNFLDGVYSGAVKSLPYYSPFDEQGELTTPNDPSYPGFPNFNPVAQALLPRFETHATKILGGMTVRYKIRDDLNLTSKVSIDYNNVLEDQFEPSTTAIGGFLPSVGGAGYGVYSTGVYTTFLQNNVVSWAKEIGESNISLLAGTEAIYRKIRSSNVQGRLFPSDDFTYITSAGIVDVGSSFIGENGLLSVFTKGEYDFKDKYLFSASLRADGSSRFGEGRRFGIFPSLSGGWRISSEEFMKKFEWISDLKLRASIGFTGNERIGDFGFLGTWAASTYNGVTGTGPASLGNPELQWERTRELNVGIDADLFGGKLQVTIDAYDNLTDNLLLSRQLPATTGFGSVTGNVGNVGNTGIELSVTTVNIDTETLDWRTSLNLSRNVNEVIALSDTLPIFTGYVGAGVTSTSIVQEGEPLGTFWGLEFLGVDPATGDAIYRDVNGDGEITDDDGTVIGNAQPAFIGGFTNSVSYKNFDLNVFFQFSYGNDILNFGNTSLLNAGEDIENNQLATALKRWQEPGDVTSVPRYELGNTFNNRHSSRFLEDGSFLRLKNVSVGYSVPGKYIEKYKIQSMRVYASATNLFTLTRYSGGDPEVSTLDGSTSAQGTDLFTLPQVKTFMLGIRMDL